MTLNEAAGRYWEEVAKHQASSGTTDYQLANLIAALGKDTQLSMISGDAISLMVAKRRATVSHASVNREVQLLRRVMNRAARVWEIDLGRPLNWRDFMLSEPKERVRELSVGEEHRLFEHMRPDFHPLIEFCLKSGARFMSAARLTWSQVDFNGGRIDLKVKSKSPGGARLALPMSTALRGLLNAQIGKHPIYVFTYECQKNRKDRKKGERYPFSKSGWRKAWKRGLTAAGISDFRFHDTRHTAGTRTLRASGNLKIVQKMLGHSDISATARYAHVIEDDVRAAMEMVEAVSRTNPEPQSQTGGSRAKKVN